MFLHEYRGNKLHSVGVRDEFRGHKDHLKYKRHLAKSTVSATLCSS